MRKEFLYCLILVLACAMLIVSCGKDEELTARVDSLSQTVDALIEENKSLKASISQNEKNINSVVSNLETVEEGLEFDASSYPVKYELTDKSYEDYKEEVSEFITIAAKASNMSESQLDATLAMLELYDAKTLLRESLGEDFAYIELTNENELIFNGESYNYTTKEGQLYVDGNVFGDIDDDVITFAITEDGMTIHLHFYRTTPKTGEKITLSEKIKSIEEKVNATYSYVFY